MHPTIEDVEMMRAMGATPDAWNTDARVHVCLQIDAWIAEQEPTYLALAQRLRIGADDWDEVQEQLLEIERAVVSRGRLRAWLADTAAGPFDARTFHERLREAKARMAHRR